MTRREIPIASPAFVGNEKSYVLECLESTYISSVGPYVERFETRPVFYPMHALPMYRDQAKARAYPVADRLARSGISLPSHAQLSCEDVQYVCENLARVLRQFA